jgi:hypothetical protein
MMENYRLTTKIGLFSTRVKEKVTFSRDLATSEEHQLRSLKQIRFWKEAKEGV